MLGQYVKDEGSGGRLLRVSPAPNIPPVTMVTWKRTGHTKKISGKWVEILRAKTLIFVCCKTHWGMTHSGARGGASIWIQQPGEGAPPGRPMVHISPACLLIICEVTQELFKSVDSNRCVGFLPHNSRKIRVFCLHGALVIKLENDQLLIHS